MTSLKLDTTWDLAIENNSLILLTDLAAEAAQRLRTKFQFFLGEWHLDTRAGFPLYEKVLVKAPKVNEIRAAYRETILKDPAVSKLDSLVFDFDSASRKLTMGFEATLVDGSPFTFKDFILGEYR